jgi:hypothetical protein
MAPIRHPLEPGQRFGRWTVLDASDREAVHCRCDCGTERAVRAYNLVNKTKGSRSCGCLRRETTSRLMTTHGVKPTDYRYMLWQTLMGKCYRPTHKDYAYYGGRGITVHAPWHDAGAFICEIITLLGPRPGGYQLDRIDNGGNYEPGNVRWASRTEQANNRRDNTLLTYNGETATIAEWSRRMGLSQGIVSQRVKLGWPVEKLLTTPSQRPGKLTQGGQSTQALPKAQKAHS